MEQVENSMLINRDYHTRKVICRCGECTGPIFEQDDYWEFEDKNVCEGCIDGYIEDYLREHRRCEYGS